jgi:hypothetical protein
MTNGSFSMATLLEFLTTRNLNRNEAFAVPLTDFSGLPISQNRRVVQPGQNQPLIVNQSSIRGGLYADSHRSIIGTLFR